MSPAERTAAAVLAGVAAGTGSVRVAADLIEREAPSLRHLSPAQRWALVDVAREARKVVR